MEKLLEIAAKSSDLKDKNDELVANNKKLQQSQKDLQDRIKEAEEILKEYKKRLAEAEKSLEEGKSAAPAVDDPVIRAHPGLEPMPWDEYRIFSPKETSYLVGLKFSKGEFINMSILILGEAASSKPNFRITFRDKDGNELEKKYRIDLSKRGIKFQQVLMKNQGWLVKDQPPVYILVEFY